MHETAGNAQHDQHQQAMAVASLAIQHGGWMDQQ
jgi:hypothetical protein